GAGRRLPPLIGQSFTVRNSRFSSGVQWPAAAQPSAALPHDAVTASSSRGARVDGALLVSLNPTRGLISRVTQAALPLVLVDAEHPRLASVGVDHATAAASAVRYLIGLGHRQIALVDRPEDPFAPTSASPCSFFSACCRLAWTFAQSLRPPTE